MDTDRELFETDATGWQRGVYDDIQRTFRAPVVNWIWRTTMANDPDLCRYLWSQVKPLYETKAFARFSVRYRDDVLSTIAAETDIPSYGPTDLEVSPAEFTEIRGQLATFDIVGPRLAVLFRATNRALDGERLGTAPPTDRAATAPFPDWLDADRGSSPSMVSVESLDGETREAATAFQRFHGLDEGLPSIYRCLAQWPSLFDSLRTDLLPVLEGSAFGRACDRADERTEAFVDEIPYTPRLEPSALESRGFDEESIAGLQTLFREFDTGAINDVLPGLHLWAATVDAVGERGW